MNRKQLREQKQELLQQMQEMTNVSEIETRALNEEEISKFNELKEQIEKINATLKAFEELTEMVEEQPENKKDEVKENMNTEKRQLFKQGETINVVEERAMTVSKGAESVEVGNEIVEKLFENADILPLTDVVTSQNGSMEFLKENELGEAGFIGELSDVSKTDFSLEKVKVAQVRCGSAIELSQHLINDEAIDIVAYSQNLVARRIGNTIAKAYINGATDGNGKIEGLNDVEVEEIEGAIEIDDLMSVQLAMHPDLQNEAVWVMNRKTFNEVAKLKNSVGDYHLVKDIVNGKVTYMLLGHPVLINNAVSDNNRAVYFVNFKRAYKTLMKRTFNLTVVDGDTKSRLNGTATVVGDIYLGASVVNADAIKALKVA